MKTIYTDDNSKYDYSAAFFNANIMDRGSFYIIFSVREETFDLCLWKRGPFGPSISSRPAILCAPAEGARERRSCVVAASQ